MITNILYAVHVGKSHIMNSMKGTIFRIEMDNCEY